MNDIAKHLDSAFSLLSKIPVTDMAVDYMAAARQELREAFRIATKPPEEEETDNG